MEGRRRERNAQVNPLKPRKAVGASAWLGPWAGSLQPLPTLGHLPGVTNSRRALGVFLYLLVVNQSRAPPLEWAPLDLTCFEVNLIRVPPTPPFRF